MRLRPRNTIRLRLTVAYAALVALSSLVLLGATYVLVEQSVTAHQGQTFRIVTPIGGSTVPVTPPGVSATPDLGAVHPITPPKSVTDALDRKVQSLVRAERDRVLKRLFISSGIALAGMLAVSVAVGWLVSGRVLRPLRRVTSTVQDITHHDLHRRLGAAGPRDEIKELSDTFDALLDRLERSFEAQRRFVANASHELRTPLARQRVIAEVALADPQPSVDDLTEAHQQVLASGHEQSRILDALLTLARGQQRPESLADCDLGGLVAAALERDPIEDVSVRCDLGPASVRGNVDLLGRLVSNLLTNAARHNVLGGSIEISTSGGASAPVLVVANTGPVIPADQVAGLLEPFRRLSTDRTHRGDGLGLGLSIVAAIADSHGASLALQPRAAGGLTVRVAFVSPQRDHSTS